MPRPSKRAKLLTDASSPDSSDGEDDLRNGFSINEDYAKRFEHNKKREEKHRLEEKFKGGGNNVDALDGGSVSGDSEDEESEDDDADLATETLDQEIMNTLQAIRSKDPKVYDKDIKFYRDFDAEDAGAGSVKKEKPMYLQDYHRRNLLNGGVGDEAIEKPVQTYEQEQDVLKKELVGSMHTALQADDNEDDNEDGFLVAKSKPKHDSIPFPPNIKRITEVDIAAADKDPESYLSNFMAARAWLPNAGSRFQAFDSDDSEDDQRAEEFEEAYNMRFEDPKTANEKLQSFARDVGKYGVRRDDKSGRKKAREREREVKEHARSEREEEKARLRRLRIDEVEEKVNRIKEAAGLKGQDVDLAQWRDVIEGDFDDDQWDQEMKRRFGEQYYAEEDEDSGEDDGKRQKNMKKPKWDDDIDIMDLVPDFEAGESKPTLTLSSDEERDDADGGVPLPRAPEDLPNGDEPEAGTHKRRTTKKDRLQVKADAKRTARKQRRQIEDMVDSSLPLTNASTSQASTAGFRYRETSPTSLGLSARDILFADDSQLNAYAGLKKLHGWRDEEKKRRDKKKFSKKGRLREWRREAFGAPEEPSGGFERVLSTDVTTKVEDRGTESRKVDVTGNGGDGGGKKKRKRPGKTKAALIKA